MCIGIQHSKNIEEIVLKTVVIEKQDTRTIMVNS